MAANELYRGSPSTTTYTKQGGSPTSLFDVQSVNTSSRGQVLRNYGDGRIRAANGGISTIEESVTIETWDLSINASSGLKGGDQLTNLACVFDGRTQESDGNTATMTVTEGTVEEVSTQGDTSGARSTTINVAVFSEDGTSPGFSWAFA